MKAVVFAYSNVGDRCLRVLNARGIDVPLVVTHRDRAGEPIWFERVVDTASELGLRCVFHEDFGEGELETLVRSQAPDFVFSFYFRAMLPTAIIQLAPRGAFNMHGSLLPHYRGRAPTNWAVLKGETQTGATLHEMVSKPDAGAIVDQAIVPILPDDTGRQVFDKVTVAAEAVLWRSLPGLVEGSAPRYPNDIERGSYFGSRSPEDGRIDWSLPASSIYNLIRAVAPPYPGAFTELGGHQVVIARARLLPESFGVLPGEKLPDGRVGLVAIGNRVIGLCGDGRAIEAQRLLAGEFVVDADAVRLFGASAKLAKGPAQ